MTPLSIPLAAAAMSVGAIQMGETSDKAWAEEDGGGVGRGAPGSLPPGAPPRHKPLFLFSHFADVIRRTKA